MKKILLILTAFLLLAGCDTGDKESSKAPSTAAAPKVRLIIDDAYTLMDDKRLMGMFYDYNRRMLEEFDIDFRVISTTTDEDINMYANRKFNEMQKHSRSHSGKALLLVVNPTQDKVRLEVSEALEPVYTDAFVSYIERKGFVPYFRDYKIADGVYAAMELIRDRAVEAREGKEFMPPMASKSIGGGAKTEAKIGQKDARAKSGAMVEAASTDSPEDVMRKYLQALKSHNRNPDLEIYTDATKDFFRKWTVTTINQDHEVDTLSKCPGGEVLYGDDGAHAVLAHRPYDEHRTCAPYFFKKENGKWKLDIATMAHTIRFNADMQWHFDLKERLKGEGMYYAYAFDGYGFDRNGYPYTPKKINPAWKKYRWKYRCNGYYHPGDRKKDVRCWIAYAQPGGAASVRLGLEEYDKIYGFGEGANKRTDVTGNEFIDYLNSVPKGEVATVIIEHYYLNGKETYRFNDILNPKIQIRYETKRGIAP